MNNRKYSSFLAEVSPILKDLNSQWFDPKDKSPEGYNYACSHCDLECGGNVNHNKDCLYQMAKETLIKLEQIQKTSEYNLDYKEQPRSDDEIQNIKDYYKVKAVLDIMYINIHNLIPLDYQDPANEGICCECYLSQVEPQHEENCPRVLLSQALANLLTLI